MTSREIAKIRKGLEMTQKEFAEALGVSALTVSQWETGYRRASSLATKAIEMLRELCGMEKQSKERLREVFNRVNNKCFSNQIKGRYEFQLSTRMKTTRASVLPDRGLIRFSRSHLLSGDDEPIEATLKHEMVHLWLYERGRLWGHTKEFKAKLKAIRGN